MISIAIPPPVSLASSEMMIGDGALTTTSLLVGLVAAGVMWLIGCGLTIRALGDAVRKFEALVVSAAVTMMLVIGQGLALNALGSLNTTGWLVSTGVLALATFPYLDRGIALLAGIFSARPALNRRDALMFAAAIPLCFVAILEARTGAFAHREFAFTEFWLLHDGDKNSDQLILGFTNHERANTVYGVDILLDGRLVDVWDGIALEPGKAWKTALSLPGAGRRGGRVEALLYKNGDRETAYRRVWLDGRT